MWFYIRFHGKYIKIWKMTPGGTKSENIERQGHQKWVERHQKWARGYQKWAKREPKGSNMEPKWNRFSENVDFMIEKRCLASLWSEPFRCNAELSELRTCPTPLQCPYDRVTWSVTWPCCLIMILGQDERPFLRNDRFHMLICQFNSVHLMDRR